MPWSLKTGGILGEIKTTAVTKITSPEINTEGIKNLD